VIFRYLGIALLWLARLIIPGLPAPPRVRVDINAPCPACGHPSTEIKITRQGPKYYVEHHCETCKARWPEDVISTAVVVKAPGEP
jgi:formate dehydrogenase maturation protein FdhE